MGAGRKITLNNPLLLVWARQSSGHSIEEIAHAVGKPPEVLRAWEMGEDSPTYPQLKKLAHKVKRPLAALLLPEPPRAAPALPDYRRLPAGDRGEYGPKTLLAVRELRNSLANLADLGGELGLQLRLTLPKAGPPDRGASLAAMLRGQLGISVEQQVGWRDEYQALNEWRDVLFDHGVLAQSFQIPLTEARAFSLIEGESGGIGLSTVDAPNARIFSMFHEAGHLCLRQPGVSGDMGTSPGGAQSDVQRLEDFCDTVAAAFLLPPQDESVMADMHQLAATFTKQTAERIARRYKVSKYVVARRVFDQQLVHAARYWAEINEWRQQDDKSASHRSSGGGADFYRVKVSAWGRRYVDTVLDALDSGVLTSYEAGKILSVRPDRLDHLRETAA
jgi:Zn-dependent peptidase ImmA (M78 family)